MLEILAIMILANKNAKNAAARGRKPGAFRGLTLGLWFGGELLGFFIGMAATDGETLPAYGVALLIAIAGGVASYIIAKTCKPGDHQELQHAPLAGEAQHAPQNGYTPQAETLPSLPENHTRALWALGGALLFMLLSAFLYLPELGRLSYDASIGLVSLSYSLVLGACVYLMMQSGAKYKAISGAGLLFGSVMRAFSIIYMNIYSNVMSAPPIGAVFGQGSFGANLGAALITAAAVGVIAIVTAAVHKGQSRQKLSAAAWIGAAAAVLSEIFNLRNLLTAPNFPPTLKFGIVTANIVELLCIALFALLVYMLCTLRRKELNTGAGAKIWFGACVVFTLASAIVGVTAKTMGIAGALIALVGIIGYILLLASKRVGFPIALIAVLTNVAASMSAGLTGRSPSVLNAIIPLAGLINPLITWLVIRNSWNDLLPVAPRPAASFEKPKVNIAFKISAILNILLGGVLFVAGAYAVLDSSKFYPEPFFLGVILGGLVAALGVTAAVQSFGKRIKMRSWLLITSLVVACLALVVFGIAFISSLVR